MRIWIDLGNSPHVNFFAGMIDDLRRDHDVLLTTRPFANTIELLEQRGFEYHAIGRHHGANKVKKVLGFSVRVWQLYHFLKKRQIDVAISHSCFNSPIVARLLGVRSIYLNDNEHAAGNRIAFPWASTIMVPEFLSLEKVERQGGTPDKVISYPGVKEGVYLWRLRRSRGDGRRLVESGKAEIFIRPEPWAAQYYRGAIDFMDDLIVNLKDRYRIVLLPRGEEQAVHYRQDKFAGICIPDAPLGLETILARCTLFIGAGGTMTREAAVLGIPTISVYQDELLDVDRYLIAQGRMVHEQNLTVKKVDDLVKHTRNLPPSDDLLRKGKAACALIMQYLLHVSGEVSLRSGCANHPKHHFENQSVFSGRCASSKTTYV